MDVIYVQRDNPGATTNTGTEESNIEVPEVLKSFSYTYNGDGARAIEVVSATNVITTVYIGGYYEYVITGTETITKQYYYAGNQRVAMRDGGTLYFLLGDHLGSTSLTVAADESTVVSEMRYSPWGSVRYANGTAMTDFTYTGQRSEVDSFGLMFYNARWYDPALGRFTQADLTIPDHWNPEAFDRYSYVYNNPLTYIDETGLTADCFDDEWVCGADPNIEYENPWIYGDPEDWPDEYVDGEDKKDDEGDEDEGDDGEIGFAEKFGLAVLGISTIIGFTCAELSLLYVGIVAPATMGPAGIVIDLVAVIPGEYILLTSEYKIVKFLEAKYKTIP